MTSNFDGIDISQLSEKDRFHLAIRDEDYKRMTWQDLSLIIGEHSPVCRMWQVRRC